LVHLGRQKTAVSVPVDRSRCFTLAVILWIISAGVFTNIFLPVLHKSRKWPGKQVGVSTSPNPLELPLDPTAKWSRFM